MATTKLVPTSITSDHHYHHHHQQQHRQHHHQHLRISRFSSATLVLLTVTSLLFFTWCYLHVLEQSYLEDGSSSNNSTFVPPSSANAGNTTGNASSKPDDQAAVQLYDESLEYFEAIQAAVSGHSLKHRAGRLRAALGSLANATTSTTSSTPEVQLEGQALEQSSHRRVRRSVLDLASMIKCITGCNPWSYKDYGCYCGFQGDGYPVDGIDRCCYMHDNCYSEVDCHQAMVYFKPYKWGCMSYGRAKCATVSGSLCAVQLCECDRKFAKCLSRFRCPRTKASCDITKNLNFIIGK